MIYVKGDVYFMTVRQLKGMSLENLSTFKTEFMVLKIKLGKGWDNSCGCLQTSICTEVSMD